MFPRTRQEVETPNNRSVTAANKKMSKEKQKEIVPEEPNFHTLLPYIANNNRRKLTVFAQNALSPRTPYPNSKRIRSSKLQRSATQKGFVHELFRLHVGQNGQKKDTQKTLKNQTCRPYRHSFWGHVSGMGFQLSKGWPNGGWFSKLPSLIQLIHGMPRSQLGPLSVIKSLLEALCRPITYNTLYIFIWKAAAKIIKNKENFM